MATSYDVIRLDSIYFIEFNKEFKKQSKTPDKNEVSTIVSCTKPRIELQLSENNEITGYELVVVEISPETEKEILQLFIDYYYNRMSLKDYLSATSYYIKKYTNRIYIKDTTEIRLVSSSSNVNVPPTYKPLQIEVLCPCCQRDRECISKKTIFDKIELRAMGGYRINAKESIFYTGEYGGKTYYKETFGFDRGGTDFTIGLETAFMFDITNFLRTFIYIPERNSFHIGPMIGVWPVDGSVFIPVSLHPRYTFNYNETDRYKDECNAWYIFGDIGIPVDAGFRKPIFCDGGDCDNLFSFFYGIGIGRDFWISECMDFSIDIGFRVSNTPLPPNEDCEICKGILNQYPYRKISQVFLRFGITW